MADNLYEVVGALQQAVKQGFETIRHRLKGQDEKIQALHQRVTDLELCVAHLLKKDQGEQE